MPKKRSLIDIEEWLSDPTYRALSASTRGIWIYIYLSMKHEFNGTLVIMESGLRQLGACTQDELDLFIKEAKWYQFCDISNEGEKPNRRITIVSREILRENIEKENNRLRQKRHREKVVVTDLSQFNKFWSLYPKKTGKGDAEKAWEKIIDPKETLENIKKALSWQVKSREWTQENGQYIPMPSTYLNQRRWEDEPNQIIINRGNICRSCKKPVSFLIDDLCDKCRNG